MTWATDIEPVDPKKSFIESGHTIATMADASGYSRDTVRRFRAGNLPSLLICSAICHTLQVDPLGVLRWWELRQDKGLTQALRSESTLAISASPEVDVSGNTPERIYLGSTFVRPGTVYELALEYGLSFTGLCAEHMRDHGAPVAKPMPLPKINSDEDLMRSIHRARAREDIELVDSLWREARRRNWRRRKMIRAFEGELRV